MDVVQLAVRDVDETGNAAPQVEQGVHLHRRLGGAEVRPREDRQAQVDGRRIQRVDGVGQLQSQILVGVQLPCPDDQPLGHLGMDAPVAPFVGIGQGRAPDRLAEAHVIELRCMDREAGLDVAQALAIGQLGEGHGPVLLGAGKRPHPVIAAVPLDDPREGWSTAENPSVGRTESCRCSWAPPRKNSTTCSIEFKSTPPIFAPDPAENLAFRASAVQLTGQQ